MGDKRRGEQRSLLIRQKYDLNPNHCKQCNVKISYERKQSGGSTRFCSKSCSTTFTNKLRSPMSEDTRLKISKTVKQYHSNNTKLLPLPLIVQNNKIIIKPLKYVQHSPITIHEPYSLLFFNKCKHCQRPFTSKHRRYYCDTHVNLYNNRNQYAFTFSISKHPTLFHNYAALLKQYGMWSYSNPNGLTRDHRISVNEAIKNNYDPYYIKHPINCELMNWQENNSKNTRSSLTYNELKLLVDKYDATYNLT